MYGNAKPKKHNFILITLLKYRLFVGIKNSVITNQDGSQHYSQCSVLYEADTHLMKYAKEVQTLSLQTEGFLTPHEDKFLITCIHTTHKFIQPIK